MTTERRPFRPAARLALLLSLLTLSCAGFPAKAASQNNKDSAKKDYALIFGTVWGPDSRPVAGVPVTIRRTADKKAKWELVSDRRGEFAQRVPVGSADYLVQADIKTPKGQAKPELTVHIDNNERKDIGLRLQQVPAKK